MANDNRTPPLNDRDIAVLLDILRGNGRPMTTVELVEAFRSAVASR